MPYNTQYLTYTDAQNRQADTTANYTQTIYTYPQITYTYEPERMRYVGQDTEGRTYIVQQDDCLQILQEADKLSFNIEYCTNVESDCPEILDLLTDS